VSDKRERARLQLKTWRENPVRFVYDNFGVEPDAWQRRALEAFADPAQHRISLQACAGPGKSAVLAWCGWNFLSCYGDRDEHPKGAAVSVTQDNLKDNLWPEFAKWQGRSPFLMRTFQWTKERIFSREFPASWFISARSWSKTANPEEQGRTLSGLHSKYIIALVDESGDIPVAVLKAGEQALSTGPVFGKMMQAGNPTSLDGMLYAAATKLRAQWLVIRITGDPEDPERSPRIDQAWARKQIEIYGRDDPWVKPYILGQFPDASINALIGVDEVEAAMRRHLRKDEFDFAQKRLGIDAARFGDDKWVIFPRQGLAAFRPVELRHVRTHDVAARVIAAKTKWKAEREYFDDTGGYAAGVIDAMIQSGYSPMPVNFAGKAIDPRFYNKRAEMLWECAQWVKRGGALPMIPDLVTEMTAHTYTFRAGKLIIIEKDQVKELIGRSPNHFDALALTFAEPATPAELVAGLRASAHAETEFDPLADPAQRWARVEFDPYRETV
jgi:phage terminase large subunit